LFVNDPKLCPANYLAYLKNYLSKSFNLYGLPIHLKMKSVSQKPCYARHPKRGENIVAEKTER